MKVFLNYEKDVPAPDGFILIETEVDFLRYATSRENLLIRGAELCAWAEAFYGLRNIPVQVVESPGRVLERTFPELSNEQAQEIAQKMSKNLVSSEEISPARVLDACFPSDHSLWHGTPSLEHAARWLLWWLEHNPTPAEKIILEEFASSMEQSAEDESVKNCYRAISAEQAKTLLWRWLGAEEPFTRSTKEFPIELPPQRLNEIKQAWMNFIISSQGTFFTKMKSFPLPSSLRKELALLTAEYFKKNPQFIQRNVLLDIQPYVPNQILAELERRVPPPIPSPLPEEETAVLSWFEREYFPYRRWQASYGDEISRQIVLEHAHTFARWLLERYPRWLLGGEHITYQKSAHLFAHLSNSDTVTFCVILDGMPIWDVDQFLRMMDEINRLTLLQKSYYFSTLPTVTQFAKEALLRGVPPYLVDETDLLGETLPSDRSLGEKLQQTQPGKIWLWRVEQPDKAYHFEQEHRREKKVSIELKMIVQEIKEVVERVPDQFRLCILITSDHGRLMNSRSPCQLPVEDEMVAHGRAAWGTFQRRFPENGFEINESEEWVELYGERFGVKQNLRIAWNESCFGNSNDYEAYPHGGLFPEEVIVPWFLFERDAKIPEPEILIYGEGEADMAGKLSISIRNSSQIALTCQNIEFVGENYHREIDINETIPSLKEQKFERDLSPWPKKSNEGNLIARVVFSLPNGRNFISKITPDLKVKVLYQQSDDLFKDLI